MTVYYSEVVLGRSLAQTVRGLGIRAVPGTVLRRVDLTDGRITTIELASGTGTPAAAPCPVTVCPGR